RAWFINFVTHIRTGYGYIRCRSGKYLPRISVYLDVADCVWSQVVSLYPPRHRTLHRRRAADIPAPVLRANPHLHRLPGFGGDHAARHEIPRKYLPRPGSTDAVLPDIVA